MIDTITNGAASDLRWHHTEVARNIDSPSTLRSLVKPAVQAVLEPKSDILSNERSSLHDGGANPNHQIADAELVKSL
jgi:hypothetical protein